MGILLKDDITDEIIRKKGFAVVGYIWECGDYCNCQQPKIEKVSEHKHSMVHNQTELLWEGTFQTADGEEYKSERELLDEIVAKRETYKVDYIFGIDAKEDKQNG